jgi:hypothetical protein
LASLTLFALHQMGNAAEHAGSGQPGMQHMMEQRMQPDDDDDWLVIMR